MCLEPHAVDLARGGQRTEEEVKSHRETEVGVTATLGATLWPTSTTVLTVKCGFHMKVK